MVLLPKTMALTISAADLNAIQIWADLSIKIMKTAERMLL